MVRKSARPEREKGKESAVKSDAARHNAIRGCLIGGAVGDALGAPVEFLTREAIGACYGADGG